MCTAHVFTSMLVAAGTSAEFGLATIATVILGGTAVSMTILARSVCVAKYKFTRERSSTIQSCR